MKSNKYTSNTFDDNHANAFYSINVMSIGKIYKVNYEKGKI